MLRLRIDHVEGRVELEREIARRVPHTVNFATATGDTLTADFTGEAQVGPIISIVEHATITGGTGRFAGAAGTFTAHRLYDPVNSTTTGSFEGTISAPGAGKS